jgi:hypothetical protein
MSSENVIHVRLTYEEALKTKRGILSSQMHALNVAKRITRYRNLRLEEFKLKSRAYSRMKETRSAIRKLENHLPKPRIPNILKKQIKGEEKEEKKAKKKVAPEPREIEGQLREIERRLSQLQAE